MFNKLIIFNKLKIYVSTEEKQSKGMNCRQIKTSVRVLQITKKVNNTNMLEKFNDDCIDVYKSFVSP